MSEHKSTPRLALLTQYFPPEVYPQTLWLAQAMSSHGFNTQVVTGVPNYPSGTVPEGYTAWRSEHETIDGFHVTRGPVFPSHDRRAVGRALNYLSFGAGSAWAGRNILRSADAVIVWATPATVGLPALWARRVYGTPYVLFVQDLWPDSVFAAGFMKRPSMERLTRAAVVPYLRALYAGANHVVAITPGMRRTLVNRGVPESKSSVVFNWVDEGVMRPVPPNGRLRALLGLRDQDLVIAFAGNLGTAQGLEAWLRAMNRIRARADIHLVLIGSGSDRGRLRQLSAELELGSVHFVDQVPVEQVSDLMADVDLAALSLVDEELFRITLPSKTQAILAQGKAVLSSAPGEAGGIIRQANAGWTAAPDDVDSIAETILVARAAGVQEMRRRGASGREFYLSHMSKEVGSAQMAKILHRAIRSPGTLP